MDAADPLRLRLETAEPLLKIKTFNVCPFAPWICAFYRERDRERRDDPLRLRFDPLRLRFEPLRLRLDPLRLRLDPLRLRLDPLRLRLEPLRLLEPLL